MKKFADLPIYFIIGGLILNVIMFFYNEVSITNLMIRSSIITILFAAAGFFIASILRETQAALSKPRKQKETINATNETTGSTIDFRVSSEDDDELLNLIPHLKEEEFSEISVENFKRLMEQDRK
jgi:hypothetical protein